MRDPALIGIHRAVRAAADGMAHASTRQIPNQPEARVRNNGLSLTLGLLFLVFMGGQTVTGWHALNEERREHHEPEMGLGAYLGSGHFMEATAENWESEFLQMAAYVLLTVFLFQRGSAESKKIDEREAVDRDPRSSTSKPDAPWPVHKGGLVLRLYENSLSLAFVLLFLISFGLHAVGGAAQHNDEAATHGAELLTVGEFLQTSQFWFESFQNWQSEFLSLVAMVVLSIYLRQRGSPESKPVDAPHAQTGSD
jgi:hypothetical protein